MLAPQPDYPSRSSVQPGVHPPNCPATNPDYLAYRNLETTLSNSPQITQNPYSNSKPESLENPACLSGYQGTLDHCTNPQTTTQHTHDFRIMRLQQFAYKETVIQKDPKNAKHSWTSSDPHLPVRDSRPDPTKPGSGNQGKSHKSSNPILLAKAPNLQHTKKSYVQEG